MTEIARNSMDFWRLLEPRIYNFCHRFTTYTKAISISQEYVLGACPDFSLPST